MKRRPRAGWIGGCLQAASAIIARMCREEICLQAECRAWLKSDFPLSIDPCFTEDPDRDSANLPTAAHTAQHKRFPHFIFGSVADFIQLRDPLHVLHVPIIFIWCLTKHDRFLLLVAGFSFLAPRTQDRSWPSLARKATMIRQQNCFLFSS